MHTLYWQTTVVSDHSLKRPSHCKLKFVNSCWQTSKSWQTRAFTRQTRFKSQHTRNLQICNMADVVQWHSRRLAACFLAACFLVLLYVNRQRRNRKHWNILRFRRNRTDISSNLTRVAYNTLVQELLLLNFLRGYTLQTKLPTDIDNSELRR